MTVENRISGALKIIGRELPGTEIRESEEMKQHCSFRAGGPVRAFLVPKDRAEFIASAGILRENGLRPYILGNGTNTVFPDEGNSALAVMSTEGLQKLTLIGTDTVYAEAGVSLARLAQFALDHSLTGLEFASGIPGSVGGGLLMNAGAYGGELKDTAIAVETADLREMKEETCPAGECNFSYRNSRFRGEPETVILAGIFKLRIGIREEISAKMRELNARRRDKQPLELPSAGSAFKRPEGHYAAALIEECGLKGYGVRGGAAAGGAAVSAKHAGFIVNLGGATYAELEELTETVKRTVLEKTGVELEREVILVPRELNSDAL